MGLRVQGFNVQGFKGLRVNGDNMATVKRFEDLKVWQLARDLCNKIGTKIDKHGFNKNFRLIHQIEGSCGEFRSQLYRAFDRKYMDQKEYEEFISIF